jgi:chondroitin sulfate proteoglycan 4
VVFVHHGDAGSGRIALRVSDGIETGAAAMMRVVAFPLQLRLVNNTGLVMTHNASSLIIPRNLAFVTNADDPELLEINYAVTKTPQFGTLQRLRNTEASGEARWQAIQHFTSFQLAREQIRYVHTTGSPTHDEFKVSKQYLHSI